MNIFSGMLEKARQKVTALNLNNIEFNFGDGENINFPANSFYRILCANAFPLMGDIALRARREVRSQKRVCNSEVSFLEEMLRKQLGKTHFTTVRSIALFAGNRERATGNRGNKLPFAQHLRWNNIRLLAIWPLLQFVNIPALIAICP